MELSIIIPSFNTRALLEQCLDSINESLKANELDYEIIVVDNHSTDGTRQLLLSTKYADRVIKILNKENLGYGRANNQGIKIARGKYLLLLNSDIVVLDQAIIKLVDFVRNHPGSFAGGKLLNLDRSPQASAGPRYFLPIVFLMLFLQGDKLGITRYSPNKIKEVDWVSGACLLGEKAVFEKVGFFDEKIFLYMEEIELLYRIKQQGHSIFFVPWAAFIHRGAASSEDQREPVIQIYRGLLYFYRKHRSIIEIETLKALLYLKAWLAILISFVIFNPRLREIYAKALRLV